MDFVLASFPWIITWHLDMRKVEKIGLCVTMSLVSFPLLYHIYDEHLLITRCVGHDRRNHSRYSNRLER